MVRTRIEPDTYKVFATEPINFNRILAFLEKKFPRSRLPIRIPVALVTGAAHFAQFLRVPLVSEFVNKVLTFIYKDTEFLSGIATLPSVRFRPYGT